MLQKIKNSKIEFFLIPLIIFALFLIIYYPGFYTYDVFNQISQINSNSFTNWHPIISTLYIMFFYKLIPFKCGLVLFQIIWFSFIWYKLVCLINLDTKKKRIIAIGATLLINLNPLMITTILSNNKDSLFFIIFFNICYLLVNIFKNDYKIKPYKYGILGFLLAFYANIRHNGAYTVYIFMLILIVLFIKYTYKDNKKLFITFIVSFIAFMGIFKLPFYVMNIVNVSQTGSGYLELKLKHYSGYLLIKNKLSESEKEELSKYVDIDSLGYYTVSATFLDPIYNVGFKENVNKSDFYKFGINLGLKHFGQSIMYYVESGQIIWLPILHEKTYSNYLWLDIDVPNKPDNYIYVNKESKVFNFVDKYLRKSTQSNFIVAILYSPATYMYLSIILLIILFKKNKYTIYLFIFNMINVLIISLSIPVQDTRYLLGNFGLVYIFVIIMIGENYEKNKKSRKLKKDNK